MRFCFLCGSLEPGKDGVGDYVRRLASELINQQNEVQAVAINDKHIQIQWQGSQNEDDIQIPVLRLPSSLPWNQRMAEIKTVIKKLKPDWISVQFVPFAFNDKGLPFFLGKRLKRTGGNTKWHIMFHELWVGMDTSSPLKLKLLGTWQRYLIKAFINTLKPAKIHTQTKLYQQLLEQMHVFASYLSLFGNIPVVVRSAITKDDSKQVSLVIFGGIHHSEKVASFAEDCAEYARRNHYTVSLTLLGKSGLESERWTKAWKKVGLPYHVVGIQDAGTISRTLLASTFGIATTPLALLEKSGSIAAMREHGLPVIAVCRDWQPSYDGYQKQSFDGISEYEKGAASQLFENVKAAVSVPTLFIVAQQFLNDVK